MGPLVGDDDAPAPDPADALIGQLGNPGIMEQVARQTWGDEVIDTNRRQQAEQHEVVIKVANAKAGLFGGIALFVVVTAICEVALVVWMLTR